MTTPIKALIKIATHLNSSWPVVCQENVLLARAVLVQADAQPAAEPVAWMNPAWLHNGMNTEDCFMRIEPHKSCGFIPLYTHPAQPTAEPPKTLLQERAQLDQEWAELQAMKRAYKTEAALAARPKGFNRAYALSLLSAASKSGNEGALSLAAQLANAEPCAVCGYVWNNCRCVEKP